MQTDSVKIEKSLINIIDYLWEDEIKNFEEEFETEIQSQDDIDSWIKICEDDEEMKSHIFYDLMVIKAAYPQIFIDE